MAVDKGLYAAPVGLASLEEEPIEIEIVAEGEGDFPEEVEKEESEFDANLAEEMDEGQLMSLASDLLGELDGDLSSRKEWLDTYIKGLKLLGLKYEERSEPWAGACGVFHPLLMESAVKFQSETIMETFPAGGPVRAKIIGKETPDKLAAAQRVEEDMNYQITEVMQEYRPEHERLLLSQYLYLATPSRRSTSTRASTVRRRCLSAQKTSSCPTARLILSPQSVLRTGCVRPRMILGNYRSVGSTEMLIWATPSECWTM